MTDPSGNLDDATLVRFLNGEASPSEASRVQDWLSVSEEHRAELEIMRAAWISRPKALADPDDSMWRWISARMGEPSAGANESRQSPSAGLPSSRSSKNRHFQTHWRVHQLIAAAAVAVSLLAGGALLRQVERNRERPQQPASAMREVTTKRGQRAVLDLADGSRVVLAAGSQLRIPDKFGAPETPRDLYLDGEAFFDVKHDATRPFRVITSAGIAEDIGTAFVVTSLPETRGLRVVVAEGVVAIHARNSERLREARQPRNPLLTLTVGEMGFVDSSGLSIQTRRVNVDAYVSWTRGELVYDGALLRDVVPDLVRWYDIDIALGDSALARRRLSATFRDEAPNEMLELLATALDVRVERRGRSVILHPASRRRPAPASPTPPVSRHPNGTTLEILNAEKAS